jgi:2,3-bisphosphoglycerate-dependent phosphoglycerate mutase
MDRMWTPVHMGWRLNERHYGALQGLNKAALETKYGPEQLKCWRRSFEVAPPKLAREDERYPGHDRRYCHLQPDQVPLSESLKDTADRLWPCWQHSIRVALRQHRRVLVVANGNSLRALVKHLDNTPIQKSPTWRFLRVGHSFMNWTPIWNQSNATISPSAGVWNNWNRLRCGKQNI